MEAGLYALKMHGYEGYFGIDINPERMPVDVALKNSMDALRAANDRGYCCLLLEDCCGAVDPFLHRAAVAMVKVEDGVFGTVAKSNDFVQALAELT